MNIIKQKSLARWVTTSDVPASTLSAIRKRFLPVFANIRWEIIISRLRQSLTVTDRGGSGVPARILSGLKYISVLMLAAPLHAVVNVYPATPALQADFIKGTTTQYPGVLTPSPYFANTYSLTITGKNPTLPTGSCPPPSTMDTWLAISTTTLAKLTVDLTQLTSDYYVQGWANGMEYERFKNVTLLDNYAVFCTSTSFPAPAGTSTTTWKVPKIDTTTCSFVMNYAADFIYSQSYSSPTIVPGY